MKPRNVGYNFSKTKTMEHILYLSTIFFLTSCASTPEKKLAKQQVDTIADAAPWADEYVNKYLAHHKDRLTEAEGKPLTFVKEISVRNDRTYAIVKIGHRFENRYVTAQSIFIDSLTKEVYEYDSANDSLILWEALSNVSHKTSEIPADGTYRFDVAFAEFQGKSMGEKVTVVIKGETIQIIYEGDGQLSQIKKGTVINEGKLIKHKKGVWIIGKHAADAQLDEIGGCTDGPAIIDFKAKKYWMC
jgi:hypothetical protein